MPRKPRPMRQARPEAVSEEVWSWLVDELDDEDSLDDEVRFDIFLLDMPFPQDRQLRDLWGRIGSEVVSYFVAGRPGHRPEMWWRVGGPQVDLFPGLFPKAPERPLFTKPRLRLGGTGVPAWEKLAYVPEFKYGVPAAWEDVDPANPPIVESQAAYLRRHGLLTTAESRRLTAANFRPELVTEI